MIRGWNKWRKFNGGKFKWQPEGGCTRGDPMMAIFVCEKKREDKNGKGLWIVTASRSGGGMPRISLPRSGATRILLGGERSNAICDPFRAVRHPEPPLRANGFPLDPMRPHHRRQPTMSRCGRGTDGQGTTGHVNREDKEIRESVSGDVARRR